MCHFMNRKLNIVKIRVLPKVVYKFNANHKISAGFWEKTEKLILKFTWESKGSRIAKTVLKKNNKVRGFMLLVFLSATLRQCDIAGKNEIIDQWNIQK